jgi:hypothetical protein
VPAVKFHVASVKLHSVSKCEVVSSIQKQSAQFGLHGQLFLSILSAVRTLLCITSLEKILLLGSQRDLHMAGAGNLDITP